MSADPERSGRFRDVAFSSGIGELAVNGFASRGTQVDGDMLQGFFPLGYSAFRCEQPANPTRSVSSTLAYHLRQQAY
jgi:hypothetical protein